MTCYFPIDCWRIFGESKLSFRPSPRANVTEKLQVPCGQCIGCRLERSRQWAIRCIHEAQLHPHNCFITLTFAPEHLPSPPTLDVRDFQLFMKRLRKKYGNGVRFFHCGEYGEQFGRPHYHACLFNFDFPDKTLFKTTNGINLYVSKSLQELWPFGFSTIGEVTFESAAYVARYIMKKINGKQSEEYYTRVDPLTGEIYQARPEYTTMSRRPGLATGWYDRFSCDVYPSDFVIIRGQKMRPPRFYDNKLKRDFPLDFEALQFERFENAQLHVDNNTKDRLNVRHEVQLARLKKLPRNLET